MKQVQWNKTVYELFKTEAMLSDDEQYIMESRIRNIPISAQADFLGVSESSVHRMVNLLKKKYDVCQKLHPDVMPIRKSSAKETWMDTH